MRKHGLSTPAQAHHNPLKYAVSRWPHAKGNPSTLKRKVGKQYRRMPYGRR